MSELEQLEQKLAELERAKRRLRRDLEARGEDPPVAEPTTGRRQKRLAALSPPEKAEEEAAEEVAERLARLHIAASDVVSPGVPADSRGLLTPGEDLSDGGLAVTVRCGSGPIEIARTLTALLAETTRRMFVTLELVPGTARENADYARRAVHVHPALAVRTAAGGGEVGVPSGMPTVELTAGFEVGRGWHELLTADLADGGTDAAAARTPQDPDRERWLPGEVPRWVAANDLAPLAAAVASHRGEGRLPSTGCQIVRPGVEIPSTWLRSRAVASLPPPAGAAPSLVEARAWGGRLGDALGYPLRVAFVILGVPSGGGGGTHSIVQESVGLRSLGVEATILLPADRLEHARSVYATTDPSVFAPFSDGTDLAGQLASMHFTVATEFPSVRLIDDVIGDEAGRRGYYLQDYEPLFAPAASRAADEALLSLDPSAPQIRFAKTRWLCRLIECVHGLATAKIEPSLDRALFYEAPEASVPDEGAVRIIAMVRPRTQRRRPAATLRVLERLAKELGEQAHVTTFGGSEEELEQFLGRSPQIEHRGILSRERVADLLRQSHLFLDLSTYQAFGRSGFEAMACGCVPVLPVLGGAQEYAEDGVNALLLDVRNDDAVVDAVGRLVLDRDALRMLRREGIRTGERFSIERAALSIYALFAHALIADPG